SSRLWIIIANRPHCRTASAGACRRRKNSVKTGIRWFPACVQRRGLNDMGERAAISEKSFPKELTALKQWVCWRLDPDPKGGKDKKIPYCPHNGKRASPTNPETWTDCATALYAKDKYLYTGIGFVFVKDGGIVGVDIDNCVAPATGELNQ